MNVQISPQEGSRIVVAAFVAIIVGPALSAALWPAVFDIAGPIPGWIWDGLVNGNNLAIAKAAIYSIPVIAIVSSLPMGIIGVFLLLYRGNGPR